MEDSMLKEKNAEKFLIENMTYDDYLGSVYTYEETAEKCSKAQADADALRKKLKSINDELDSLGGSKAAIQKQYDELLSSEINRKKDLWKKSQARFDFKLSNKKAAAEQSAQNDIQACLDEYNSQMKTAAEQVVGLEDHLKELDRAYGAFTQQQADLANFEVKSFPPADADALNVLENARDKKLLTKYQRAMLGENIDVICKSRLKRFDELIGIEKEFSASDFYRQIVDGTVTDTIFNEVALTTSIVFVSVLTMIILVLSVFQPSAFSAVIHSIAGMAAFGGAFASAIFFLRNKYSVIKKLPFTQKAMTAASSAAGCVIGFCLSAFLIAPVRNTAALIYFIMCAVACGLLVRRLMLTSFSEKIMAKIPSLKNRARKNVFSDHETLENGRYNFMIFCYLMHGSILDYLSIQFRQNEIDSLRERIDFNRKDHKYYTEELKKAKGRTENLKKEKIRVTEFVKKRNSQLKAELESIEAERPPEPDFETEAKKSISAVLVPLQKELSIIEDKIACAKAEKAELSKDSDRVFSAAIRLKKQKTLTANALRQWKKTPLPESTDYRLLDTLCIDSKTSITMLHHELKPYVIRYSCSEQSQCPGEILGQFIYRYIRGLCKINPRRLMQINIFDYVSDPKHIMSTKSFTKLTPRGVIEGIYSMKDFEIRIFPNAEGYSTFKDFFKIQCGKIGSVIKENKDKTPEGTKPDIAFANKLKSRSGERFLYQVCIFIVPREYDQKSFRPPKGMIDLIDRGGCIRLGLLPVFIADENSVSPEWNNIISKYDSCSHIFPIKKQ